MLKETERNLSTIELEALSIVVGLEKGALYITDYITIFTDHSNLQFLPKAASAKVRRWMTALAEIPHTIVYRAGKDNKIADCLSRMLATTSDVHVVTVVMSEKQLILSADLGELVDAVKQ